MINLTFFRLNHVRAGFTHSVHPLLLAGLGQFRRTSTTCMITVTFQRILHAERVIPML